MTSKTGDFTTFGQKAEEPRGGIVSWSEELETGIEIMDQQHRQYVDLLNVYLRRAEKNTDDAEKFAQLIESFQFLLQYAADHFSTEELIMQDVDFPDYQPHLEEHLRFLKHVEALSKEMQAGGFSPKLSREVNFYAIEWFIDHILEADMKLVKFLKERNLEARVEELV